MTLSPQLIQLIGFVGVAVFILSYQIKSNRGLHYRIDRTVWMEEP